MARTNSCVKKKEERKKNNDKNSSLLPSPLRKGETNEVSDLCKKLNIELKSTAAESVWSNGMVERHNGILANMMEKVLNDVNCSIEIALSWSIAAKNALHNVYGFS